MKKYLNYKGILFDDYSRDDNGHYWAEICQECFEKYRTIFENELDNGNTACGICSVCGCSNSGELDSVSHYYIDFIDHLITWKN